MISVSIEGALQYLRPGSQYRVSSTVLNGNIDPDLNSPFPLDMLMYRMNPYGALGSYASDGLSLSILDPLEPSQYGRYVMLESPLNYPNPFRQEEGTTLTYHLSDNMETEIRIYDMMAHQVFHATYSPGFQGGKAGWNRLVLTHDSLDGVEWSAGIYFYLVLHQGKVLGKGKMAVVP